MTDDIKELLGKAIGEEPPIDIDRDEVFRVGRQRVRRRRMLAAGGVVAAVVIAAVGATVLTNFVEITDDPTPPAAGSGQHAPPGPELPLTTEAPPSSNGQAKPPLTSAHASELTILLYRSGVVPANMAIPLPGQSTAPPAFRVEDNVYLYEADVVTPASEGVVQVTVDHATPGKVVSCNDVRTEFTTCVMTSAYGSPVAEATWKNDAGDRRNVAMTIRPDGTTVAAVSTNLSRRLSDEGKSAGGSPPVIDMDELTKLIVKSGFRAF